MNNNKVPKLDKARKPLANGTLPKAVPFDAVPINRDIANKLWPEQFLIEIIKFNEGSKVWDTVTQGKANQPGCAATTTRISKFR